MTVSLPALTRSASSSPSSGNGPTPSMPFSDCRITSMPGGNVVGHQRGRADAEIHVVAVAQLLRHAARDQFPLVQFAWPASSLLLDSHFGGFPFAVQHSSAPAHGALFDALLVALALENGVHVNARRVHLVRAGSRRAPPVAPLRRSRSPPPWPSPDCSFAPSCDRSNCPSGRPSRP